MLIGGATAFGLALMLFGLVSQAYPSYLLVMAIMLFIGIFNSIYMISIMSSLQMMVPNSMRGRVMGFYGMTWSIMPLGGMQGNWIANYLGAPIAVMIGGLAVAGFAVGPALLNKQVRNISALVNQVEQAVSTRPQRTASAGD